MTTLRLSVEESSHRLETYLGGSHRRLWRNEDDAQTSSLDSCVESGAVSRRGTQEKKRI